MKRGNRKDFFIEIGVGEGGGVGGEGGGEDPFSSGSYGGSEIVVVG